MKNARIINGLCLSYAMELETVQNYIAASVNLDGVRSEVIKKALAADIAVEVQHAQQLAARIKTIGGLVPGSLDLPRSQAIAISMEIGIHNGTLAIFIALTVLQNSTLSVPAAVYSIIMFVTASAFTFWLNRGR